MKSALVSLHGWKNEEYSYFGALVLLYGFMAYLFLKNGSRKTNEIEKKCRIETIGQEQENRKTKFENRKNRRMATELWITTIIIFSQILLYSPRFSTYRTLLNLTSTVWG